MSGHDLSMPAFGREALPRLVGSADGQRILLDVQRILEHDRWSSFDRFHRTTEALLERYEAVGAATELYQVQTGGQAWTGRWIIPEAADLRQARAAITWPRQELLLDSAVNPFHVARWSASTPPGGWSGELVVIDDPQQLAGLPRGALQRKALLTSLALAARGGVLVDKGAAVVLSDAAVGALDEAVGWVSFGWAGPALSDGPARPVGLSLSAAQGRRLRELLRESGRIELQVEVEVPRYLGTHDVVSGLVRGAADPQDEVWLVAHDAEPGAVDNASGVAVGIEVARLLEQAIAAGELPRPRRSVRIINAHECYGFFAYLERARRFQTPLAGVCVDCVGLRPELCGGRLEWHATIASSAQFVNELGADLLRQAAKLGRAGYRLYRRPFVSTCDTLLGDPRYGFPCPWVATWDSRAARGYEAYHSSADRPELLHPEGLAAVAAAMAGYLWYLADMGTAGATALARGSTRRTLKQLATCPDGARRELLAQQHREDLDRLRRWWWTGDSEHLKRLWSHLADQVEHAAGPLPRIEPADLRVPRRKAPLTPSLDNVPRSVADRLRASPLPTWTLFWADGRRTLDVIAVLAAGELQRPVTTAQLGSLYETLAELGYVDLVDSSCVVRREELEADLRRLGLAAGMDLMVHSSLSALGHVEGGPETVIDALTAVLGAEGTLLMPSFHHGAARVYNPLTTPTVNGAIPEAFWRLPGVLRSDHPTHAVAARGPRAAEYLRDHRRHGIWAAESPIGRLVHGGGYVLSLGVGHESTTAYHVAEIAVPCGCLDMFGSDDLVVDARGAVTVVPGLAWRERACPVPLTRMAERLAGRQRSGRVGRAEALLTPASEVWRARHVDLVRVCPSCPIRPHPRTAAVRR